MAFTCRTCQRMNPPEALYCYFDGVALDAAHARGPVATGAQRFPNPFVMPSGHACGTFDELVLACETDWEAARSVVQQGYLENFLGHLGRVDLALATRVAAASPDPDRGLDELLAKLPNNVREPAKLEVIQREIDLGEMPSGCEHRLTLHLKNIGMGLLQGTVSCSETAWLAVGEAPAGPQKMFQCRNDLALPVQVVGKALRANAKPLTGKLVVESNGGAGEVLVRVQVPVKPFPDGVLAGARTPRQVAEKAKASPKEAAVLFARGAVAAWYESNGWIYPVQGPSATGLGAVQQFFEALGLVAAPKVTISTDRVLFQGEPGAFLEQMVQVQTVEKRPVYAHATSKSAWLLIGKIQLKGQTAHIPLLIPSVPSMPGEELQARIEVAANGNQHFAVDVTLTITEDTAKPLPVAAVVAGPVAAPVAATIGGAELALLPDRFFPPTLPPVGPSALMSPAPPPLPSVVPPMLASAPPFESPTLAVQVVEDLPAPAAASPFDFRTAVDPDTVRLPVPVGAPSAPEDEGGGFGRAVKHLGPLVLLLFGLGCMLFHDYRLPDRSDPDAAVAEEAPELPIDPKPYLQLGFHDARDRGVPKAMAERLGGATMRFGLVMTREPIPAKPGKFKKLTFSEYGVTNNACVRVDGKDFLFGEIKPGKTKWDTQSADLGKDATGRERDGRTSVWEIQPQPNERIVVAQTAEIVAGAPLPGEKTRRLDTCLVRYDVMNAGGREHQVGIRFLLDTFIGLRDGVPFTIPGRPDLCDTQAAFDTPRAVPDFIQVLENDDLRNPGTVARVQFRIGKQLEPPSRVFLGGWPDDAWSKFGNVPLAEGPTTRWFVPHLSMRERKFVKGTTTATLPADSCVTMYWDEEPLKPGETRRVGFAYGLGSVASQESGGRLLLTVGGRMSVDAEVTLAALVQNPDPQGETLTLKVPTGMELTAGREKESVPILEPGATRKVSTVTWKLRAKKAGEFPLVVKSSKGVQQTVTVQIRPRGVFD
jgi:hypothetical protein